MKKLSACSALIGSMFLAGAIGCGGGSGMNFNDGSWSMCTFKNKEGFEVSIPMQTALPIGAAHPNGTVLKCEPIPAKE